MVKLKFYRTYEGSKKELPKPATKDSACFDISFSCEGKTLYTGYSKTNKKIKRRFGGNIIGSINTNIYIGPGDRILVPTGFILDIPKGYSVRIHPRSGISLKQGLVLANSEGVIDSDYIEELFIMIYNISDNGIWIKDGDRIAQGELVQTIDYDISETKKKPIQKTNRVGGLGSTGIATEILNEKEVH